MKFKNGLDLCGFALTNFCIQGLESMPSDAALGRKYFHTNATDDVATGISLLNRERIYLGEGAWRATAYLDDIAAINEKLNLITGDTDTDTLINNLKDLEEFLKDFSETDKLKSLLDGKLNKSGGTIAGGFGALNIKRDNNPYASGIQFSNSAGVLGYIGFNDDYSACIWDSSTAVMNTIIHSGNIGSYKAGGLAHSNGTIGAVVNSSGNVTIGSGDLAGTSAKLYVDGDIKGVKKLIFSATKSFYLNSSGHFIPNDKTSTDYWWGVARTDGNYAISTDPTTGAFQARYGVQLALGSGNVLIGTTTDRGHKLAVYGVDESSSITLNSLSEATFAIGKISEGYGLMFWTEGQGHSSIQAGRTDTAIAYDLKLQPFGGCLLIGTTAWIGGEAKVQIKGNLYVDGNIIATKEVSAGGAGAEEGTSGSGGAVDFHSEKFMPSTSTLKEVNHNLGKDVIVQVYEEGATSDTWNLVMVDVEIVSATKLYLRFGKVENTYHKVVVMGAGV